MLFEIKFFISVLLGIPVVLSEVTWNEEIDQNSLNDSRLTECY